MVFPTQTLFEAIQEMDAKDLGATLVVEEEQLQLVGIITDGDLRRLLKRKTSFEKTLTGQVMTPDPKSISPEVRASEALEMMEQYLITILPIVDIQKRVLGILHLHDLLGKENLNLKSGSEPWIICQHLTDEDIVVETLGPPKINSPVKCINLQGQETIQFPCRNFVTEDDRVLVDNSQKYFLDVF